MELFKDETPGEILCEVLSRLSLKEIGSLASMSRRVQGLVKEENSDLWCALCLRRWKEVTDVKVWCRRSSWRVGALLLHKWEGLIGVWKGFFGDRSQLLVFEWSASSIQGFKIYQPAEGSFHVKRVPFLWMGISSSGEEMCFVNPVVDEDTSSTPETKPEEVTCSYTSESVFSKLEVDRSKEEVAELGLVPVNVKAVGKHHIIIDEVCAEKPLGKKQLFLGEAVTSASFGVSEESSESPPRYGESPPGSFSHAMYEFLTSRVMSSGGDRAARRQRKKEKKEKERAESRGIRRRPLEQLHFVKMDNLTAQPLEVLEGLCQCKGLEHILLSYVNQGIATCRQVDESINLARDSGLVSEPEATTG